MYCGGGQKTNSIRQKILLKQTESKNWHEIRSNLINNPIINRTHRQIHHLIQMKTSQLYQTMIQLKTKDAFVYARLKEKQQIEILWKDHVSFKMQEGKQKMKDMRR